MPATSVTGRGPGSANGVYKPQNNQRTAYVEQPVIKKIVSYCSKTVSICRNNNHSVSSNNKIILSCNI